MIGNEANVWSDAADHIQEREAIQRTTGMIRRDDERPSIWDPLDTVVNCSHVERVERDRRKRAAVSTRPVGRRCPQRIHLGVQLAKPIQP